MNGVCPIGFDIESAFSRLKCQTCPQQCILSHICKELRRLSNELAEHKEKHKLL